jgi:hypothetical protein
MIRSSRADNPYASSGTTIAIAAISPAAPSSVSTIDDM